MRVVIADDSPLVRRGIASLLEKNGVEVAAELDSAAELHEAVMRLRPDVAAPRLIWSGLTATVRSDALPSLDRSSGGSGDHFPGPTLLHLRHSTPWFPAPTPAPLVAVSSAGFRRSRRPDHARPE